MNDDHKELCKKPSYQAFQILRIGFTILPIIAGLDKFFHYLTNWDLYLSKPFNVTGDTHTTMLIVGVIEIIAGLGVWFKPRIFAYIVALWLIAIIVNLVLLQSYYDIALRDFGLVLGALALGKLSHKYNV